MQKSVEEDATLSRLKNPYAMKLLPSLPGLLVAALCLAVPATGFSHDHRSHGGHGHFYSPRFHGLWLPPIPLFFGASPFYGYGGPSVSVNVEDEPAPIYRSAHVESQGDELSTDVQQALHRDGYYHGDIDGDIGVGTRAAIRQYQYDHQLEVTGRIDRALLRSLGLD